MSAETRRTEKPAAKSFVKPAIAVSAFTVGLIFVLFRFLLHFRGFLNISAILQMLSRLLLTARVLNPKSVRTIQELGPEDLNKIQVLPDPGLVSPRDPTGKSDESIGSGCRVKA